MDLAEAIPSVQDKLSEKMKKLHVTDDNKTQLNSNYFKIPCVVQLKRRSEKFYSTKFIKEKDFSMVDILSKSDKDGLKIFENLLHLFYQLTICLQGNR